jgi:hypothetical protein
VADSKRPRRQAPRIKGAAFREFLRFYATRRGADRLRADAERLPVAERAGLELDASVLGVVASSWYPARTVHLLLDAMVADLTMLERRGLAAEGSQAVMEATLRGLYKVLFEWMATPDRYARYAPKLWELYYDTGMMEVTPDADGLGAVAAVRDFPAHHPFMCELNRGAASAIYAAMGCEQVDCKRVACVADGAAQCKFVTRWQRTPT